MTALERLQKRMEELGHAAKKSLGQNFLISDGVISKILKKVENTKPKRIVEVGPGLGALTEGLLAMKLPLTLIEMDRDLAKYWRERGAEVLEGDALQISWENLTGHDVTFVSNLPYQISSSIVIERSLDKSGVGNMVLMFQKEVAQRIVAPPRRDDYGMLSVVAQNFWKIETVSEAGPRDFHPPPKVASRVLGFQALSPPIDNRQKFLTLVKEAFKQRRKLVKSNLKSFLGSHGVTEHDFLDWLTKHGLKETARAEEISPELFKDLYGYINHTRK
jgi:16S rRNA (adenine1518-N6/adenine1519-N6)-dimethyltransferase